MVAIFERSNADIVRQCEEWWRDSSRRTRKARNAIKDDFAFYAGNQWSQQDEAHLKELKRPIVTFNRVAPTIDAVAGTEETNRQETRFIPRDKSREDGAASEMWTETARWVRDECDAEDEESHAFRDSVICGMGWTDTWVDFEASPDGQIIIERTNPLEVYWDPDATRRNLSGGRRVQRIKMMAKEEIKAQWPGVPLRGLTDHVVRLDNVEDPHNADEADEYINDQGGRRGAGPKEHPVLETQWWERRPIYRMIDPNTDETVFLTKDEHDALQEQAEEQYGKKIPSLRQTQRRYFQAFTVGKTLLEKQELHPNDNDHIRGFTLQAITGKYDEKERRFYGLMRGMKDPQQWSNKFFSQIQDIINSNAKGGLLAEQTAFENPRKAEEDWAKPEKIVWLSDGSLSGQKPRVQERTSAAVPPGLDRLMQIAISAVRETSGVNIEMVGLAARTQSGIVEQSRIAQGLVTLSIFFTALRRYRKEQGRVLLHMMNTYIPDGTMIRVVGKNRYVPFARAASVARFDLIVDQAPTSPNFKQEVWNSFMNLAPALVKAGVNLPWQEMVEFSPLPQSVQDSITKFIQGQQPSREQQELQARAQEAQVSQLEAEVQKTISEKGELDAKAFRQIMANFLDAEKNKIELEKVAVDGTKVLGEMLNATSEEKKDNDGN